MGLTLQDVLRVVVVFLCPVYVACHIEERSGQGDGPERGATINSNTPWLSVGQTEASWKDVPRGRFEYVGLVRGGTSICHGALVDPSHVLTAAHCMAGVGQHPLVEFYSSSENGGERIREVRVKRSFQHPYQDVALLRLAHSVDGIAVPVLALAGHRLHPNFEVAGFRWRHHLQVTLLKVVANELCPHLQSLDDGRFCAFSHRTSMQSGSSGGPILVVHSTCLNYTDCGFEFGDPRNDVIVGVVSSANYSRLDNSGVDCVQVSGVENWVSEIIYG